MADKHPKSTPGRDSTLALREIDEDNWRAVTNLRTLEGQVGNLASNALHQRFGFKSIGVFSEVGRKFGKFWDVMWMERPLKLPS